MLLNVFTASSPHLSTFLELAAICHMAAYITSVLHSIIQHCC